MLISQDRAIALAPLSASASKNHYQIIAHIVGHYLIAPIKGTIATSYSPVTSVDGTSVGASVGAASLASARAA